MCGMREVPYKHAKRSTSRPRGKSAPERIEAFEGDSLVLLVGDGLREKAFRFP
jgi:hypothetical protein